MVNLKRFQAPRAASPAEVAMFIIIALILGAILGAQGALYESRQRDRQEMQSKVESRSKIMRAKHDYAYDLDQEAPAHAQDAAKKYTRRVGR